MIPEKHRTRLINDGIHFMRSIAEAYGVEDGMRLWKSISDTLDPELKGAIFFALLTGSTGGRILIRGLNDRESILIQKVSAVKCIRTYTGFGLKEAKEICDELWMGKDRVIEVAPDRVRSATRDLLDLGFKV